MYSKAHRIMQLHTIVGILVSLVAVGAGPPVFDEKEVTKINAYSGETLEIKCSATGDPKPSYKWYYEVPFQNGEDLGPDSYPPVEIKNESTETISYSVLIFNETKAEYSGSYTCTAINSHGLRSKIYEVFINETNDKDTVVTDAEFHDITDRSVNIHLKATGNINTVKVKYAEKLDRYYSQLNFKDKSFVVDKLSASGEYNFTFAVNAESNKIVWSKNYTVVLRPGIPDVIFKNLNGGVLNIEWFRTMEDFKRETIDQYLLSYYTIQIREGSYWRPNSCRMKIEIPLCFGSGYTISNLYNKAYYQIELQAHTSAGYGPPSTNKVYIS